MPYCGNNIQPVPLPLHEYLTTHRSAILGAALRALPARVGNTRVCLSMYVRMFDDNGGGDHAEGGEAGRSPGREDEPGLGGGRQGDEANLKKQ